MLRDDQRPCVVGSHRTLAPGVPGAPAQATNQLWDLLLDMSATTQDPRFGTSATHPVPEAVDGLRVIIAEDPSALMPPPYSLARAP